MASSWNDEEINKGSGVTFFGRDIMSIPCLRKSGLIGIPSGVAAMLLYFMFTSKPQMACHVGYGTFVGVTLSYWSVCRYQLYKVQTELEEVMNTIKEKGVDNYRYSESFDGVQ